jgi:hypothetical protein
MHRHGNVVPYRLDRPDPDSIRFAADLSRAAALPLARPACCTAHTRARRDPRDAAALPLLAAGLTWAAACFM